MSNCKYELWELDKSSIIAILTKQNEVHVEVRNFSKLKRKLKVGCTPILMSIDEKKTGTTILDYTIVI